MKKRRLYFEHSFVLTALTIFLCPCARSMTHPEIAEQLRKDPSLLDNPEIREES
jgi:hypothetical protein